MDMRRVMTACAIGLVSIVLAGCYFSAGQQVFDKTDLTRIEPARLEPVVSHYSRERNPGKYIISATPKPDGAVRLVYSKNGIISECDLGFIYLKEPVGYFIMTNLTKRCSFFSDSEKVTMSYYYIVAANVPVEKIPNPVMRAYVGRETATFIWPYHFVGNFDNFRYLAKKQNIDVEKLDEYTLLVRAVEDLKLSPMDKEIIVIENDDINKWQVQDLVREAIRFKFFVSTPLK